jgi:hypothetical protein
VYVLEDGEPKAVKVQIGIRDAQHAEVTGGDLKEGAQAIVGTKREQAAAPAVAAARVRRRPPLLRRRRAHAAPAPRRLEGLPARRRRGAGARGVSTDVPAGEFVRSWARRAPGSRRS